ncbi:MAG: DUF502 domain-containing protein [Acidobacteriota bacterium]|nr:DUF502 domain-containing protein [Acidobacteriota bacterium]
MPVFVTFWLFALILRPVQMFVTPPVLRIGDAIGLGGYFDLPGAGMVAGVVGLILTVVVIYLIGLAGSNILGRTVVRMMDNLALSIPLVKSIYGSARQLVETFYSSADRAFDSVVLIEYPRKGIYTVALVTAATQGELRDCSSDTTVNVFVPTTPNPTSGVLVLAQKEELVFLDMTVEEALRFVVSGGIVAPQRKKDGTSKLPS